MSKAAVFVGLTTIDTSYLVDDYPEEDSKIKALTQFIGAGGPAANAAVTYTALAGDPATLVTALGKHDLTQIASHDLRQYGVSAVDVTRDQEQALSISSIIVARSTQSRTIVSLDGQSFQVELETSQLAKLFDNMPVVVLVDGHYPDLTIPIARQARELNVPVVFDGGRWKPSHADLLPFVDIAICSSAFRPPMLTTVTTDTVLTYLHESGPKYAAITNGDQPLTYSYPGVTGTLKPPTLPIVDTLGAGDILHGAFCYYYAVEKKPFAESLSDAMRVATISCCHLGTREWITRHRDTTNIYRSSDTSPR